MFNIKKTILLFDKLRSASRMEEKLFLIRNFEPQVIIKRVLHQAYDPVSDLSNIADGIRRGVISGEILIGGGLKRDSDRKFLDIFKVLSEYNKNFDEHGTLRSIKILVDGLSRREYDFYMSILTKYPDIGLTHKSLNSLYPSLFSYANGFMKESEYHASMSFKMPVIIEPVMPGIRVKFSSSSMGSCSAYTEDYSNCGHLFKPFLRVLSSIAKHKGQPAEVDAIVSVKNNLNINRILETVTNTNNNMHVRNLLKVLGNPDQYPKVLEKFDICIFDFIFGGSEAKTLEDRRMNAIKYTAAVKSRNPNIDLKFVPGVLVKQRSHIHRAYTNALRNGYTGIMIKDPFSPYVRRKDTFWLKMEHTGIKTATIVELIEGIGKLANRCAGMVVDMEGKQYLVPNMSDKQRETLWAKRNYLPGTYCRVEKTEGWINFVSLKPEAGRDIRVK